MKRAPLQVCWTHNFIPVRREGIAVVVAFADPLDHRDLAQARELFQSDIIAAIASKKSIQSALRQLKPASGDSRQALTAQTESVVSLVEDIIVSAINEKTVSDIHIEPMRDRLRIRFRLDGVLIHHRDFPARLIPAITSRIKILCEANIAEKRRHQGGRIVFTHGKAARWISGFRSMSRFTAKKS